MTASTPTTPDARIGLSHPGGVVDESEREVGWRMGVADSYRAVEFSATADDCRQAIMALGNAGPDRTTLHFTLADKHMLRVPIPAHGARARGQGHDVVLGATAGQADAAPVCSLNVACSNGMSCCLPGAAAMMWACGVVDGTKGTT